MLPQIPGLIKDEAWHAKRARGIGSSDWNHLLADSDPLEYRYWCIRKLYYEKNMVKPDFPEFPNALTARGTFLEDKILEMFKIDTGCKYVGGRQKRAKYACPGILLPKFWRAQPDARAKFPEEPGVISPVEAKSMGSGAYNHYKEHGLSVGYKLQCQSHNAMQQSDMTWLVVGYFGDYLDYQSEPMPRDDEVIAKMVEISTHFWEVTRTLSVPPPRPPVTPERCGSCRYRIRCIGHGYMKKLNTMVDLSSDAELYSTLAEAEKLREDVLQAGKRRKALMEKARQIVQSKGEISEAYCREFLIKSDIQFTAAFDRARLEAEDLHTARRYIVSEAKESFSAKITKRSRENWEAKENEKFE